MPVCAVSLRESSRILSDKCFYAATCKLQSAVYCPGLADIFTYFILGLPSLWHACPKWHAAFTTVPIVFISLARPVKNMCICTHI